MIKGKVWKFGDNINTDEIIPARYLNTSEPSELAKHCMEDADAGFMKKARPGDIIIGGKNFGCGSSREHASISVKTAGISCVIASSFARIFYRNSFNIGLPIFESEDACTKIDEGDIVSVDPKKGLIVNETKGQEYRVNPIPEFMEALIAAGGLIKYVTEKIVGTKA